MRAIRVFLTLLALIPAGLRPASAARPPKLVVVISVDQFRADYLSRFRSGYTQGLARLLERGAVFTNAYLEHFPTVTAIGHAAILTGAMPSLHGIVGNEWFDRERNRQVNCVFDDTVRLVGASGGMPASPRHLLVSTVADELKMAGRGPAKVIGISLKDRAAILTAGRMADAAYWFDGAGNFISSSYYMDALPAWVREFNESAEAEKYAGEQWFSVDGAPGNPFLRLPDTADAPYFTELRRTPWGNELVEDFAERAVEAEALGRDEITDLLSVSFSSIDYAGHRYGPHSAQIRDMCLRLDRVLGRFFTFLDDRVGPDSFLAILTADHGVAPVPEQMRQWRMPAGRLPEDAIGKAVEAALTEAYGPGQWVIGYSGPEPYLNHQLVREKKLDLAEVRRRAVEAAREVPHMLRVYSYDDLQAGRVGEDYISRRVLNGFHPTRSPDLAVVMEPYWLFEKDGTSHGTPHNYDAHVPVVFMGPGIRPGPYRQRTAVNDIAPTLAAILELEMPSGASGRVLEQILAFD